LRVFFGDFTNPDGRFYKSAPAAIYKAIGGSRLLSSDDLEHRCPLCAGEAAAKAVRLFG
jgi:hypothetical protein